jgi:prepilin-type N-terminal cleavage/methylation domain-containing protein
MKWFRGNQKGFTLIELLVVIPIIGIVSAAAAAVIVQILHSKDISSDTMAIRQVQMAGDRVSQDGVQAPTSNVIISDNMTAPGGFLNMSWTGYWVDTSHVYHSSSTQITYTLAFSQVRWKLLRHETTVTDGSTVVDSTIIAGENLDPSQMTCTWDSADHTSFTFKVVAEVNSQTQSREYRVQPRIIS